MTEPDNLVLQLLREMRGDITDIRTDMATRDDIVDMRSEINSLRADVASDFLVLRKELSDQIVGLRRAVVEYHSAVIGHGMIISDLEARLRRVEQHLNLSGAEGH